MSERKKKKKKRKLLTPQSRLVLGCMQTSLFVGYLFLCTIKQSPYDFFNFVLASVWLAAGLPFLVTHTRYKIHYWHMQKLVLAQPVPAHGVEFEDNSDYFDKQYENEGKKFNRLERKWRFWMLPIVFAIWITAYLILIGEIPEVVLRYVIPIFGAVLTPLIMFGLAKLILAKKPEDRAENQRHMATVVSILLYVSYAVLVAFITDVYILQVLTISLALILFVFIVTYIWHKKEPKTQYVDDFDDPRIDKLEVIDEEE